MLSSLKDGAVPGISPAVGGWLSEAGSIMLDHMGHEQGVPLTVGGDYTAALPTFWNEVTEQDRRSWSDLEEATEYGAAGIACLLMLELTDFTVIERSQKGTGFDYWLGRKADALFRREGRLEVSGIARGEQTTIARRLAQKRAQTQHSHQQLPCYIVIAEFSAPRAEVHRS